MIAIHQSQFIPWVPYFFKIYKSDQFVILDNVQYQKNGLQNRNKIKTPQGSQWLTIPVSVKLGDKINEIQISNLNYNKLLKTISANYNKSPFFVTIYESLNEILTKNNGKLIDLNNDLLNFVNSFINNSTTFHYSGNIKTHSKRDNLVIEIIKHFNETEYLAGKGSLNYMNLEKFKDHGIKVFTFDYSYIEYPQLWNNQQGFIADLSIVDLLFNNLTMLENYINNNGKIYCVN